MYRGPLGAGDEEMGKPSLCVRRSQTNRGRGRGACGNTMKSRMCLKMTGPPLTGLQLEPSVLPPLISFNPTTVLARGVIPARGEFNEETASRKWSNCQAGRAVARTSEPRCSVQKCWVRPVNLFPLQERGDSGPSALLQTQALWR